MGAEYWAGAVMASVSFVSFIPAIWERLLGDVE